MTIQFKPQETWRYQGGELQFERYLGDDLLHFVDQRTLTPLLIEQEDGVRLPPTATWALEAYARGDLVRIPSLKESMARQLAQKRDYEADEIRKKDKFAVLRRFVVQALDKVQLGSISGRGLAKHLSKIWASAPQEVLALNVRPHLRTVRRWLSERGSPGERPFKQMMSQSGRVRRRQRLPPLIHESMNEFALLYWSDRSINLSDAFARFATKLADENSEREATGLEPLSTPSRETFRKLVRSLECFETYRARYGKQLAKVRFEGCGTGLKANRFLELGCMDHKYLDNVVVVDLDQLMPMGRPYLTAIIDVYSRCIVGFVVSFEPPSLYSATECIKRANSPKLHLVEQGARYAKLAHIYGRFDEIVVDNGWELVGTSFEDASADAGISVRWAPVRSPTYKAVIERFFRTIDDRLLHKLPGSTLNPQALRDLEIDPDTDAVLTLQELEELIWEVINLYHLDIHSEINACPAQLWGRDAQAHGIPVIADVRQFEKMAGAMEPGRRLSRSGIEFLGLKFHDRDVTTNLLNDLAGSAPQRGQGLGARTYTVKVKYNPANLGEIHVWNDRRKRYETLPCTEPEYAQGLSKKQHELLREFAAKRNEAFSSSEDRLRRRAELSQRIEGLVPGKGVKNRRTIARLAQSPMVQELHPHGVVLALASPGDQGFAPVIEHDTLAPYRTDGGTPSSRPARRKKQTRCTPRNNQPTPKIAADADFGDFEISPLGAFK